ncbi:uncharacterized protein LOC129583409 [Paramacrobiotus metropolitanus]|uniref:uncharacterized protein LOC129583409 n=1 Tax=Paramacrobiotus metropolitanus TaxID=2943436 RepID=UPI002445FD18|nr:uncharacterized protein LOC129583409 [Paramacrobiotus metropolitanus]
MTLCIIFLIILSNIQQSFCQAPTVISGFPVNDCGTEKGCIGFPEDGCLAAGKCSILIKFSHDESTSDKIPMELFGTPPAFRPQNFWIGVGFNPEGQKMGGTLVTECVYHNGGAGVFNSKNVPNAYVNQRLPTLIGLVPGNASIHNGILGCSFLVDRVRVVDGITYDFSMPLHIAAGNGPAVGSTIKQHFQRPYMSADAIVVAPQTSSVEAPTTSTTALPPTTFRTVLFEKFLHGPFTDSTSPLTRTTSPSTAVRTLPPRSPFRDRPVENHPMNHILASPNGNRIGSKNANDLLETADDNARFLSHTRVVSMIMRYLEPPLKMIVDMLNRGAPLSSVPS